MKFIGPDINCAISDSRIAIQIGARRHRRVVACVNAWRVRLQPKIAVSGIYKQRVVGDAAEATRGQRSGATVPEEIVAIVVVRIARPVKEND